MNFSFLRSLRYSLLCLGLVSICVSGYAQQGRQRPQFTKDSINLDKELEEPVAEDRALSYYHFSLSKWYESNSDMSRALTEMKTALKYNRTSPAVHLEMASLMEKFGDSREAIQYAEEAARLDPKDPDPHWLLVNIYLKPRMNSAEGVQKAIQELEKLRELAPNDERIYYTLGQAYFETNQPEKAIQAFEKFQTLSNSVDNGYRAIAKYYQQAGNEEKAIEYFKKALEIQPDSTDALIALGDIYNRTDRDQEAIPIYRKLRELTNSNPKVSQHLAAALIEANQLSEAIKILDELAKNSPGDAMTRLLRGRALIGLRRFPEAIEALKPVTEEAPDVFEAQYYLGRAYELNGNYSEAAKMFASLLDKPTEDSTEARSNRFVFQQHLAANYMEMGDHEKGLAIYQEMAAAEPEKANPLLLDAYRVSKRFDKALPFGKQLFEKDPGNTDIGVIYARTLADAGKTDEGSEILSNLLKSHPDDINLHVNLSQIYLQAKRYDDAEEVLMGALKSHPENVDLYMRLSQIYLQAKRYDDAEKVLLRAENRKLDSESDERVKFQRAALYEKQKDFDRAESLFKEILKANPNSAAVLNYIGYMLADRGVRLQEAVRYVQEALAIEPGNGAYLDSLGWAYFKLNDLANAEQYLLEADAIVKNDPVIDDHLGDLYFKTGDLQKARTYWQQAIDYWTKEPAGADTEQEDVEKVRHKLENVQDLLRKQQKSEK